MKEKALALWLRIRLYKAICLRFLDSKFGIQFRLKSRSRPGPKSESIFPNVPRGKLISLILEAEVEILQDEIKQQAEWKKIREERASRPGSPS